MSLFSSLIVLTNKSSDLEDFYVIPKAINTDENGVQTISDDTGGTVTIDKSSSFDASITLTFTGKGTVASETFNNTSFKFENLRICLHKARRRDYIKEEKFKLFYTKSFDLMNMMIAFRNRLN